MLKRLIRCLHHRWLDASDVRRKLPNSLSERLEKQVQAGEARHRGEVRLCIEASLPARSLWQHFWHVKPMAVLTRERAWAMFSKLGVWDTEQNNGVLIYLLWAERRIEIVADRGLGQKVSAEHWQAIVQGLAQPLAAGQFEAGLQTALSEVNALLVQHFGRHQGQADSNELADTLLIL